MRHDWIFETLRDLKAYASINAMPRLVQKVEEALDVARAEVQATEPRGPEEAPDRVQ